MGQATANLTRATVAGEPVQSVRLSLQGNGDEVRGHFGVWMAAGNAQGDVRYLKMPTMASCAQRMSAWIN